MDPVMIPNRGPERIRVDRDYMKAMVATDTFAPLADRVERMLSHGRRITMVHRPLGGGHTCGRRRTLTDAALEVTAGLTVEQVDRFNRLDRCGISVILKPGLRQVFGFSAPWGDQAETERQVWERFYDVSLPRENFTKITMRGGLADDGPARDDQITIRKWNSSGYASEIVVVFDYGDNPTG
jgi:hypothetical protein